MGRSDSPFIKPRASAATSARLLDLLQAPPRPAEQLNTAGDASTTATRPRIVPEIPEPQGPVTLPIRVALLSQAPIRSLTPIAGCRCSLPDGRVLDSQQLEIVISTGQTGQFHCRGGRLRINDRTYGDALHLINRGEGWLAVNELDLEDYIASVVGAEMPSHWPEQALQAQAIAARSYAMAHLARPADRHWNLGDTTRWQAYNGLGSESTRGREAAQATMGLILSVDGGIVESLYAATRQLTLEAHGRLGASMSQHGARELAEQGYRYSQILATYYPGASLSRLERR